MRGHTSVPKVQQIKDLGNVDGEIVLDNAIFCKLTWEIEDWCHLGHTLAEDAVSLDGLLEFTRLCGDTHWVPHLYKQRFQEVWQPEETRMCVGDFKKADTR